jgi:hypothetical protein
MAVKQSVQRRVYLNLWADRVNPSSVITIQLRAAYLELWWVVHVERVGNIRNVYKSVVGKRKWKKKDAYETQT